MRNRTSNVLVNIISRDYHVQEVERNIREIKDITSSTLVSLHF